MQMDFSQQECNTAFDKLEVALKNNPIKRENGLSVFFTDFMLMQKDPQGRYGFKDRKSRNYVFLLPNGTLYIPVTANAFMLGKF